MNCTRCDKNEATIKLDIIPIANENNKMNGLLCEACGEELLEFLYSCTCHIKEK